MQIKINEIKSKAFSYQYNSLSVKVKITLNENEVILSIGLSNPKNKYKYENWFVKIGSIDDNQNVLFGSNYIEHPPFLYYKRYLLNNNSLSSFFDTLKQKIVTTYNTEEEVEKCKVLRHDKNKERLYTVGFVKLSKGSMSQETKNVIKYRYNQEKAERIIKKCNVEGLTVRFSDDITKNKCLEVN